MYLLDTNVVSELRKGKPSRNEHVLAWASGQDAATALAGVLSGHKHRDYRQVLVLDRGGRSATHSGRETLGVWAEAAGTDCAAGGNILADKAVPAAMVAPVASAHVAPPSVDTWRFANPPVP